MKLLVTTVAIGLMAMGAQAQTPPQEPAPDNTKVNQADRDKTTPTAGSAKNNTNDREIMQKIRKAVMDEKALSTYAHNVKIISQDGKVTLRGPVRSEEEKKTIEQKATDVACAGNVTNEITIKPEKNKSN